MTQVLAYLLRFSYLDGPDTTEHYFCFETSSREENIILREALMSISIDNPFWANVQRYGLDIRVIDCCHDIDHGDFGTLLKDSPFLHDDISKVYDLLFEEKAKLETKKKIYQDAVYADLKKAMEEAPNA